MALTELETKYAAPEAPEVTRTDAETLLLVWKASNFEETYDMSCNRIVPCCDLMCATQMGDLDAHAAGTRSIALQAVFNVFYISLLTTKAAKVLDEIRALHVRFPDDFTCAKSLGKTLVR